MAEWLKVVILGMVEGVTEFLPISSTGHLIVVNSLLEFRPNIASTFEIFIQLGAVLAVILFYARDLRWQAQQIHKDTAVQQFWVGIILAFIPAAVLGYLLSDYIEAVLFQPTVVAVALIVGGILFLLVEHYKPFNRPPEETHVTQITLKQAGVIGLCQLLALVPGMSRSGMSILGGMLAGLPRSIATQFSFYLAIPTLGSATIYALVKNLNAIQGDDLLYFLLGTIIAGLVAWGAMAWLLRYVAQHSFIWFGYYRILAGMLILLLVSGGLI